MEATENAEVSTGHLTVYRSGRDYRDRIRDYLIEVDGKEVGSVSADSSVTISLPAGAHKLKARIDWTGSPTVDIDITSGQDTRYRIEPAGSAFTAIFQIFSGSGYLKLVRD